MSRWFCASISAVRFVVFALSARSARTSLSEYRADFGGKQQIRCWYGQCSGGTSSQCVNHLPPQPPGPLTRELLGYWIQHPEALDTVEAIVEWWLLEHRIQQATVELQSALSGLVANGFVVRQQEADGRIYYQLNREKEAEIIAWLQSK